ncbi:MBL fold metallo-hydrolase [Nostoc sp.]|uniref:MBL fold metallo-hydrolase n=1 Tax=Nostoc sp. TaxID=1180 RepID=UPI002FF8CC21
MEKLLMRKFRQLILMLFIFCFIIGSVAMSASAMSASTEVPAKVMKQAPGFYRGQLGDFEVTVLSDGTAPRHLDQILSAPRIVRDELTADHEVEPVELSINAYLINTGAHLVLVDTGAGELFGSSNGLLVANIVAAGYRADQVDTILLTHIHADHSGGLSIGGKRQFPNATVYVDGQDVAYWLSKKEELKAPISARKTFEQSQTTVNPYVEAKRLVEIKPGLELVPGFLARSAPGHTPGHTAYLVESRGHKLFLWGDTIHSAKVQFSHPQVTVQYDVKPDEAAQTREQLLDFAAKNGVLVGSDHISFPGLGHVRKVGNGYRWIPIPYTAHVTELDPKP